MNHQIIRDEAKLKQFIEWLPDLSFDEGFYLTLQARRKYFPNIKSNDKTLLQRFTCAKASMFEKIQQLECPVGSYRTKDGTVITDDGIALYITINPRCLRKAAYETIRELLNSLQLGEKHLVLPIAEAIRQVSKAKSRTVYVHFDLDMPTGDETDQNASKCVLTVDEVWEKASEIVGAQAVQIVRTRGGCHVLIDPKMVAAKSKSWHLQLQQAFVCDQIGDLLMPVVGCCQGGFTPHFTAIAAKGKEAK